NLYVATFTRLDGLAFGGLVALLGPEERHLLGHRAVGLAALAAWLVCLAASGQFAARAFIDEPFSGYAPWGQRAGYSVLALGFAHLVARSLERPAPLLLTPALRAFGRYSYGIYVWHPALFGGVTALGLDLAWSRRWLGPHLVADGALVVGLLGLSFGFG